MNYKSLKSKRIQAAIVMMIAALIVLVGAFAWNSFSQGRINTFREAVRPGVNLHDDFEEGPDKDVYVENSGDVTVFVRVRLTEYLETAGRGSLIDTHVRDEETAKLGWFPHNGIDSTDLCEISSPYEHGELWNTESFHDYYEWKMGGQKYYKTAVAQLGEDGAFADNPEVCVDMETYDGTEEDVKQTLWADVITMSQWMSGGYTYYDGTKSVTVASGERAFGNFWVVDTDGWCYWAQPLEPKTATGLLLDSVNRTKKQFDSSAEYCINVWLQSVDEIDVGLFGLEQNGGMTTEGKLLSQLVSGRVVLGDDGSTYENNRDGTFIQIADGNGNTVEDAKAFVPLAEAKVDAPERLYIGETFTMTRLIWDGEDYTNFDSFSGSAPYYNISQSGGIDGETYTLIGTEKGADGNVYLKIEDSEGNVLYLSSTVLKAEAQMAAFGEISAFNEGDEPEGGFATEGETGPEPHIPLPQFEKYIQAYPGTGPFAIMYPSESGKIGTRNDVRYDVTTYEEARYFYHLGNGVYVEVNKGEKASYDVYNDSSDGNADDNTIYYFSNTIYPVKTPEAPYQIDSMDGSPVAGKVEAAFFYTLQIGEFFGYYDAPNTGFSIVYKGDEMVRHQTVVKDIARTFTMKPIYMHKDKLYIETTYESGEPGWQLDQENNNFNSDFHAFIMGMGETGEFGGAFFGVMMELVDGEMTPPAGGVKPMGDGKTEATAFKIRSRSEMDWITNQAANGESFDGVYFKIDDSVTTIDMSDFGVDADEKPIQVADTSFTPIGTAAHQFKGIFDGDGKTISNLKMEGGFHNRGLFGCIGEGGVVKNLVLENASVEGNNYVGGVAGQNYGEIANCHVTGGSSITGVSNVGGVVGRNYGMLKQSGSSASVIASNLCAGGIAGGNNGTMQGLSAGNKTLNTGAVSGVDSVGGIVGISVGTVENYANEGTVTATGTAGYVGGIAGQNGTSAIFDTVIISCDNNAAVSAPNTAIGYVGGIVGRNYAIVKNCENKADGAVTNKYYYTGGISGYNSGTTEQCDNAAKISGNSYTGGIAGGNGGTVTECDNSGKITSTNSYTGGIAGGNTGTIKGASSSEKLRNTGEVISSNLCTGGIVGESGGGTVSYCDNSAPVSGVAQTGGIVGRNNGTASAFIDCDNSGAVTATGVGLAGIAGSSQGRLENCDNTGAVTATGTAGYVGGVVGQNGTASNTTAVVTGCTNNAPVKAESTTAGYVGGISAYNYGKLEQSQNKIDGAVTSNAANTGGIAGVNTGAIEQCDNASDVSGTSYVGGIAGNSGGTVTECENSGEVEGTSNNVGGVAGSNGGTVTQASNRGVITGASNVGGVAGSSTGTVTQASNGGVITGASSVGGVAGSSTGTVSYSSSSGEVNGNGNVGGVVGFNNVGKVQHCEHTGTVKGADVFIGGIAGQNSGAGGEISDCVNTGSVTATDTARYSVGGVVGYNYGGTVKNCENKQALTATTAVKAVGGVVGHNHGTAAKLQDCKNSGGVTSPGDYLGGIVGLNATVSGNVDSGSFSAGGEVSGCENSGKIDGAGVDVGGIAGYNYGTVKQCENSGVVEGAKAHVGGIVGYNTGTVTSCANKANVTGGSGLIASANSGVGGVVGWSTSTGTISQCYSNAERIYGYAGCVGGVIGYNLSNVSDCYAWGDVEGKNGTAYAGGVMGITRQNTNESLYHAKGTVKGGYRTGGAIGSVENSPTVKRVVALASSVAAQTATYVNKLTGVSDVAITNGYALSTMTVTNQNVGVEGTPVSLATTQSFFWWAATVGFVSPAWVWDETEKLPVLNLNTDSGAQPTYLITSRADMDALSGWAAAATDGLAGRYFKQTKDIDMTAANFTPIGTNTTGKQFLGTFDGQGYEIRNLTINRSEAYMGLFGCVGSGGAVENVKLKNASISGWGGLGGVAGYNYGRIADCSVEGAITCTHTASALYIGGIVGSNLGSGVVTGCTNSASITATVGTGNHVGGIAGQNTASSKIEGCVNNGTINAPTKINVGGIAGDNSGVVSKCQNTGNVTASTHAGGVAGTNASGGVVELSSNKGKVLASGNYGGGVVAHNSGTVRRCYHHYATDDGVKSLFDSGGVVGYSNGTVTNCYAIGGVQSTTRCAGGIAGYSGGALSYSFHYTGNVSAVEYYAAGVSGQASGTISNCVAFSSSVKCTNVHAQNNYITGTAMTVTNCHYWSGMATQNLNASPDGIAQSNQRPGLAWWRDTAGYDFTNIWEWTNGNYPTLKGVA